MYTLVRLCICAVLAAATTTVSAYGARGHQVVGAIADKLLNPTASQNVNAILGMPLRVAATWADCAKDVKGSPADNPTTFTYTPMAQYHESCKAFETPEGIARMENYVRRNWSNWGCRRCFTCDGSNAKLPCN